MKYIDRSGVITIGFTAEPDPEALILASISCQSSSVLLKGALEMLVALVLISSGCSSEHPVKPTPIQYGVYVGADERGTVYVADIESLAVVDSIRGMGHAFGIAPSVDGNHLFISGNHPALGRSLMKYSLESRQIVISIPATYWLASPLLVLGGTGILRVQA